jgi:hypothetical protein
MFEDERDCDYMSSRGILKCCDFFSKTPHSGISRIINYDFTNLHKCKIPVIYICNTAIKHFYDMLFPQLQTKFILISGDSDSTMPYDILKIEQFNNLINNDKLVHWFCQNLSIKHPKMTIMPIGLDYHTMVSNNIYWGPKMSSLEQEKQLMNLKKIPFWERELKGYSNFHLTISGKRYTSDRTEAINNIPKDLMFYEDKLVDRITSWNNQLKYTFCVSPLGNGYDCHRTWEGLCLGCIVIVKTSCLDELYENLPVLIISNWKEVNKELLEKTISEYKIKHDNNKFNYDKLKLKYWLNIIEKCKK